MNYRMKNIYIFVLLMGCAVYSNAQARFGFKAGYNLSSFYASYVTDVSYSSRSNFNAGVLLSIPISEGLSFQPEAFYSGEGANINTSNLSGVYNFQYLDIPFLLKYKAPIPIFIETGPQIGFLLGAAEKEQGFPSTDVKDDTKSTGFSWVFGLGYELRSGFGLDALFNLGLTDVAKASNTYNSGSIKNNVFQVGIFYLLPSASPVPKN